MNNPHILVADDQKDKRVLLEALLEDSGYEFTIVSSGNSAWTLLCENPDKYSVALLDRMMPGMNGMELLKSMKEDSRLLHIPVIFQTGMTSSEDIAEGLLAGAYYYIAKPYPDDAVFLSIIHAAVEEYQAFSDIQAELDDTTEALHLLDSFVLHFKTLDEVNMVNKLIAKACPDPQKVGMGLSELLINAVEHGSVEIAYTKKGELKTAGTLISEVERRLALPENSKKRVKVSFERTKKLIRIVIKDEGPGFEWHKYLQMDPDRVFDNHGRGIAMANLISFDKIEYYGTGSEVHALVYL